MAEGTAAARIGCSGYEYKDWRGLVYPEALAKRQWFEYYTSLFDTVEINGTFYRLPEAATFDTWRDRAPTGFLYALKMSRYGSHLKHLADPAAWVPNFTERAIRLGDTLGPVLVQLPPRWRADTARLDAFLDTARKAAPGVRWAVEVRDASWLCKDVYSVLERHGSALCIHDLIPAHPRVATTDWMYLRFHGPDPGHPYCGSYSGQALSGVARRIRAHLDAGLDVYAYFNNDIDGCAVADARRLRSFIGAR